jgi:hypothetical protein
VKADVRQALAPWLLALAACSAGCAGVAPWERGRLAKPHMALDPSPQQQALRDHVHASREASPGTKIGGGGGCGCD